jgi:hypothetical protein
MATLGRISVTPVKGTELHHPDEIELTGEGIAGNRRFHLVDERDELLSGYDAGTLVQVRADVGGDEALRCAFPDGTIVEGPTDEIGEAVHAAFDDRHVDGHHVLGPFDAAFSSYVGKPVRLVRTDREGDGPDVHRLTLLSSASVSDLGARGGYDGELDARRFRLNLEIDGAEPFEEDTWAGRDVRIGEAVVQVLGQVPRCRVVNQDPTTGVAEWGTLKAIAAFRPLMHGDRGIPFGMYAEVRAPGRARVGDPVAPVELPDVRSASADVGF